MRARKAQLEKWFEVTHYWIDFPKSVKPQAVESSQKTLSIGFFSTALEAHAAAKRLGLKYLGPAATKTFLDNAGDSCYGLTEHLIVLHRGLKSAGFVVDRSRMVRLTKPDKS